MVVRAEEAVFSDGVGGYAGAGRAVASKVRCAPAYLAEFERSRRIWL